MATKNVNIKINQKGAKRATQEMQTYGSSIKKTSMGLQAMAAIITTVAASAVARLGADMVKLAGKAEGVERAFLRLNKSGLLTQLRAATSGTVNDLELMQAAVRANNFQIPLENLGTLLRFAKVRAQETGESVDFLVNSIVMGIGRKSPLILDNLGLSVVRVREEFKKTGDMAAAVASIANEELAKVGDQALTTADKLAIMNSAWDNFKVAAGDAIIDVSTKTFQLDIKLMTLAGALNKLFGTKEDNVSPKMELLSAHTARAAEEARKLAEQEAKRLEFMAGYNEFVKKIQEEAAATKLALDYRIMYNQEFGKAIAPTQPKGENPADIAARLLDYQPALISGNEQLNTQYKTGAELYGSQLDFLSNLQQGNLVLQTILSAGSDKQQRKTKELALLSTFANTAANIIISTMENGGWPKGLWAAAGAAAQGAAQIAAIQARETGGPVSQGQPYLVGERGPELMVPDQSGMIIPNGAHTGMTINFNGSITDRRFVQSYIIPEIKKAVQLGRA